MAKLTSAIIPTFQNETPDHGIFENATIVGFETKTSDPRFATLFFTLPYMKVDEEGKVKKSLSIKVFNQGYEFKSLKDQQFDIEFINIDGVWFFVDDEEYAKALREMLDKEPFVKPEPKQP